MSRAAFGLDFEDLPESLPLFPLSGALLLPFGRLPLNIFEPRYFAMVEYALKHRRLIGMVQPRKPDDKSQNPDIFSVGGAGRIVSFNETMDGRFEIILEGLCRFKIEEELPLMEEFRRSRVSWQDYAGDMDGRDHDNILDRDRLAACLEVFFPIAEIQADWQVISATSDDNLITSLAMSCPFAPGEKQALLEAPSVEERADILISLIEMAIVENGRETALRQ